jgi:hypothetical protein
MEVISMLGIDRHNVDGLDDRSNTIVSVLR